MVTTVADVLTFLETASLKDRAAIMLALTGLTPTQPEIKVGNKVRYIGQSLNKNRTGFVLEVPGPSEKYNGRPAERYEIRFDASSDFEFADGTPYQQVIFADRKDLVKL